MVENFRRYYRMLFLTDSGKARSADLLRNGASMGQEYGQGEAADLRVQGESESCVTIEVKYEVMIS